MNIELNILKGNRHLCIVALKHKSKAWFDVFKYRSSNKQIPSFYGSEKTIKLTRKRALKAIKKYIDLELKGE